LIQSGRYDVALSGHSHETIHEKTGDTLAVNPGMTNGFDGSATIALLDTEEEQTGAEFIE